MIAKQVKGCDFRGCLDYLLNRETAAIIGGNLTGDNPETLAEEFKLAHQLNKRVKRYVYHASLSLAAPEKLCEDKWKEIAIDYLKGMGFTNNQYLLIAHNDTNHNHIHIVASRIKMDGKPVHDHWDFVKSEKLVRELEKKYDLQPTLGSKDRLQRSPTTGETRLRRRTGESSVREFLQEAIDEVCTSPQTMPSFIEKLTEMGIETRITPIGKDKGISFKALGIAFSGTHLGRGYTFPGLQKYKEVDYVEERDDKLLFGTKHTNLKPIIFDDLPPVDDKHEETLKLLSLSKASQSLEIFKHKETSLVL